MNFTISKFPNKKEPATKLGYLFKKLQRKKFLVFCENVILSPADRNLTEQLLLNRHFRRQNFYSTYRVNVIMAHRSAVGGTVGLKIPQTVHLPKSSKWSSGDSDRINCHSYRHIRCLIKFNPAGVCGYSEILVYEY